MSKPSRFKFQRLLKSRVASLLDAFLLIIEQPRKGESELIEPATLFDAENIAILAAFNETPEETRNVVSALSDAGYSTLVIRNVGTDLSCYEDIGDHKIVNRKNVGFDIGAYRDAFELIGSPTNLILLNTSMYWDKERLTKVADRLKNSESRNTVTYLTESLQGEKHGQSFFLHLKLDSTTMDHFESFMKNETKNWRYKRSAVKYGEKAIFNYFNQNESIGIDFIFSYSVVSQTYLDLEAEFTEDWIKRMIQSNVQLNPTQHLWPALDFLGFPGFKKTLLSKNPANLRKLPKMNFEQT
jgi:hypothetical protein